MRQQNAIIFTCLLILTTLSSCGVKKSLYQTPEKPQIEENKTSINDNKENSQDQQEKH